MKSQEKTFFHLLKKQEKRHKKNLYFIYNKSDYQVRNCYFKKKIISDKLSTLELIRLDIKKLILNFCQMRIYTNLQIKTSSKSQITQVLIDSEIFINYML